MSYRLPPFSLAVARQYHRTDFLTERGARQLADMMEEAWHRCGHTNVRAWVEEIRLERPGEKSVLFGVRSNLIAGLPPPLEQAPPCSQCGYRPAA